MNEPHHQRQVLIGIGLAVITTIIWSGNFIIAKGIIKDIPPVTLSFYRWLIATIIILPFAWKYFTAELNIIKAKFWYFFLAGVTGVSMFNTFVYIAGQQDGATAINMALIGTCTSPIISVVLARIFLHEKVKLLRIIGMVVCIIGVLFLMSKGKFENLLTLKFSHGDWWMLAAATSFAIYNVSVKKKPADMHSINFLFVVFLLGTVILIPFYIIELRNKGGFEINIPNVSSILYLGLGASVICFFLWNKAIGKLGAGRTALFGNLIPVFSSIEAVILLNEKITGVHVISFILVAAGLLIANLKK